jgi:hypothetical protein
MSRTIPCLGLAFLLAVTACGDNPAGPDDNGDTGTFTVSVTGALTASFSGNATFVSQANDAFGLALYTSATTAQQYVQVNRENGGRPGTGTYTIHDGSSGGQFIALARVQNVGITSNSGTMTITSSSTGEIEGQISYQGTVSGGGGNVTITASFRAKCPTNACT